MDSMEKKNGNQLSNVYQQHGHHQEKNLFYRQYSLVELWHWDVVQNNCRFYLKENWEECVHTSYCSNHYVASVPAALSGIWQVDRFGLIESDTTTSLWPGLAWPIKLYCLEVSVAVMLAIHPALLSLGCIWFLGIMDKKLIILVIVKKGEDFPCSIREKWRTHVHN